MELATLFPPVLDLDPAVAAVMGANDDLGRFGHEYIVGSFGMAGKPEPSARESHRNGEGEIKWRT